MFTAKENFLDRMEQSFMILKSNAKELIVPYLIFNLITLVVLPAIFFNLILAGVSFWDLFDSGWQGASVMISLLITGGIFLFILYLIVLIPFQIWMLLSIKQALWERKVTFMENVKSCFPKILKYITVYWYIFAYTLLIPALIFIVGWFLMIGSLKMNWDFASILSGIAGIFIAISVFLWLFFMIYRGIKTSFALTSAVELDTISKIVFTDSLTLSDWKWLRLFWNFVGVWLIGGLLIGLVSWLWNALVFAWTDFSSLTALEDENASLSETLSAMSEFNIAVFLNQAFQNILGTILGVYISIFGYIFYRRLVDESSNSDAVGNEKTVEKVVLVEKEEL